MERSYHRQATYISSGALCSCCLLVSHPVVLFVLTTLSSLTADCILEQQVHTRTTSNIKAISLLGHKQRNANNNDTKYEYNLFGNFIELAQLQSFTLLVLNKHFPSAKM